MDMPESSTDSGTRRNCVTQAPVSEYGRTGGCARCEGKTAPHNNDCRERIVTILTFTRTSRKQESDSLRGRERGTTCGAGTYDRRRDG